MELNEKQKAINSDPMYWEWFQDWWDEDFSWEGLADKTTKKGVPLQTHYAQYSNARVTKFGKSWHPLHLPGHDPNGDDEDIRADLVVRSRDLAVSFLSQPIAKNFHGVVRRDLNIGTRPPSEKYLELEWCVKSVINSISMQVPLAKICYIDGRVFGSVIFTNCTIGSSVDATGTSHPYEIQLIGCRFSANTILDIAAQKTLLIKNAKNCSSVKIRANSVTIRGMDCDTLDIAPSYAGSEKNEHSLIDIKLSNIKPVKVSLKNDVAEGDELKNITAKFSLGPKHSLRVENYHFETLDIRGNRLGLLEVVDCVFQDKLSLPSHMQLGDMCLTRSIFHGGVDFNHIRCKDTVEIFGCKIYEVANFNGAIFNKGLNVIKIGGTEKHLEESIIVNGSFVNTEFHKLIVYDQNSCAIFNDTEFAGSVCFDGALFDGVPKFHGCKLHQESSFRNLEPIPEIEGHDIKNDAKNSDDLYNEYQTAFRTLRQHLEGNASYAAAFKFGRLEMIAKQKRGVSKDVPKSEILFTKWYGKLADYGQTFIRPLGGLFLTGCASIVSQVLVLYFGNTPCFNKSDTCQFAVESYYHAFERGLVFAIPPFTTLTNSTIKLRPTDVTASDIGVPLMSFDGGWNLLSGGLVLLHAMVASLFIFLFLLAIKRRLQIR